MAIETVTMYKIDGRLFESEEDALRYEKKELLEEYIKVEFWYRDIDLEDLVTGLILNWEKIKGIMES